MQQQGFFGALFDLSFSEFITTKLVKVLYVLLLVAIAIGYVFVVVTAFADSFLQGLLMLVVGAIVAFLYVILARVWMEIIIVLFRICENTTEIAQQGRYRQ